MPEKKDPMAALLASVERIEASLATLARLRLLAEFYSPEERARLIAEHAQLIHDDKVAYERLHGLDAEPGTHNPEAFAAKQETSRRYNAFAVEHPLIVRLVGDKTVLSKSPYE